MSRRVLIFDSGVGGLSVMQALFRRLPALNVRYLADNACFPYGDLAENRVIERCCELVSRALESFPAEVVVIACNTASTVVLPALRARISVPVVGVVPAVKPAAAVSENRRIGLLATPGTVRRPYLDNLIAEFASDCEVIRAGSSELVRMAEALAAGFEPDREQLDAILRPFCEAGVDTVVLGCTHFPLIKPQLQACLPEVKYWVDSGEAIARRVESLLGAALLEPTLFTARQPPEFYFTGPIPANLDTYLGQLGLTDAQTKTARTVPGGLDAG
ncbi:glutamate racemase [Marinobacteraceae bacterium S3BR75-40.1]